MIRRVGKTLTLLKDISGIEIRMGVRKYSINKLLMCIIPHNATCHTKWYFHNLGRCPI